MIIYLHVAIAILAIILGAYHLFRPKGTDMHKFRGRIYVVMVLYVSLSGFWIQELWKTDLANYHWRGFTPVHLTSFLVPILLIWAIIAIRKGKKKTHQNLMIFTYFAALVIPTAYRIFTDYL